MNINYKKKYIAYAICAVILYFIFPGYYEFKYNDCGTIYRANKLTGNIQVIHTQTYMSKWRNL
jgi:hypothetical protein